MKKKTGKIIMHESIRLSAMLVGCVLYSLGLDCFLVSNEIVGGGVSGLASLIYLITDQRVSIGLMTVVINLPILLLGLKQMGWKFMLHCLLTSGVLSLCNELFIGLPSMTDNRILAAVYGGILEGLGIGIFVKFKVSSGGTELLGREIRNWLKLFSIPVWTAILDAVIIISGSIGKTSFMRSSSFLSAPRRATSLSWVSTVPNSATSSPISERLFPNTCSNTVLAALH